MSIVFHLPVMTMDNDTLVEMIFSFFTTIVNMTTLMSFDYFFFCVSCIKMSDYLFIFCCCCTILTIFLCFDFSISNLFIMLFFFFFSFYSGQIDNEKWPFDWLSYLVFFLFCLFVCLFMCVFVFWFAYWLSVMRWFWLRSIFQLWLKHLYLINSFESIETS